MESGQPKYRKLESLQALRAVAALMVVIFHAASVWREKTGNEDFLGAWDMGWAGVDLFFVISGFVMVWVTQDRNVQGPRSAINFFGKRFSRIFPIWWVFCALMGLYFWMTYGQPAPPPEESPHTRFWLSMVLWPQDALPVLAVGWTLIFEMGFYALFALLILLPSRFRLLMLLLWGGIILWSWSSQGPPPILPDRWSGIFLSPLCLEFVFGAAVAQLIRLSYAPRPIAMGLICGGVVGYVSFMILGDATLSQSAGLAEYSRVWVFGLPAALLILGLASLEVEGPFNVPAWLSRLGDASYALYLLHLPLLLAVARSMEGVGGIPSHGWSFAIFVILGSGLCAVASLYVHRYLERPLMRVFRFPLVKRPHGLQG